MRNYTTIPVVEAITIVDTIIGSLIKGFENIGFRPAVKKRLDALEDLAILQEKRIKSLEQKIK